MRQLIEENVFTGMYKVIGTEKRGKLTVINSVIQLLADVMKL